MRGLWLSGIALLVPLLAGAGQTHLVIVSGIGGEPQLSDRFYEWSVTMIDAARTRWGLSGEDIVYLAERVERDPARITGRATKEGVESALREVAERAGRDDVIFTVLIGHGSASGDEARFNLPGPDMSAGDFATLLTSFSTQRIVFVNLATASGEFVKALSGVNRTIVTATKSGFERNESIFGGFFVAAFAEDVADVDKDGRVSVLEAFTYAAREVRRTYEADGRLLTEHALLDDNGDGEGSVEPSLDAADGTVAGVLFLAGAPAASRLGAAGADSVLVTLYREKQELEQRIATLRGRRNAMPEADYQDQLEALLVELALTTRAIREREGGESP